MIDLESRAATTGQPSVMPGTLPPVLISILRAAFVAEERAAGDQRRRQFRATRSLLAAARTCGYSLSEIAEVMGRSLNAIRGRAGIEGTMSIQEFANLAGIPIHRTNRRIADLLAVSPTGSEEGPEYPCAALLRALIRAAAANGHENGVDIDRALDELVALTVHSRTLISPM